MRITHMTTVIYDTIHEDIVIENQLIVDLINTKNSNDCDTLSNYPQRHLHSQMLNTQDLVTQ